MRDLLVHRGPDSAGEFSSDHAFLGIRRLSVIDLVTGDQPIRNEDGSVWAVLNGEIYNFIDLRQRLQAAGHVFRTASDTEVLVHAYEEYGDDAVERIEGMFALAIWDEQRRRLVLARDRLGKKPLLYAVPRPGTLTFASEFRALLSDPDVDRSLDPRALDLYLSLGYIPAPVSAYRGIAKLLPGHRAVWENGALTTAQYWQLPPQGTSEFDARSAEDELLARLRAAVRDRLVADVPVGAFLSGGVDSSLIVALMAEESGRVRTFSIGFDVSDYSELAHARRVAERFSTEHHEAVIRPDVVSVAPLLAAHYGEPFADSSAVPVYYLSKLTREHVTVALCGDGGDEAFAGYDRYRGARVATALGRLPPIVLHPMAAAVRALVSPWSARRGQAQRAMRLFDSATAPQSERYLRLAGIFSEAQKDELLDPALTRAHDVVTCTLLRAMGGSADPAERANLADLRVYLPDDLLVKVDIASMANSLEVRAPYLDRRIVEFGVGLPMHHKIGRAGGKLILKRLAERFVPRENVRRPKMGFGVPVSDWFRAELRDVIRDTVLSPAAIQRGIFREDAVRALVEAHQSGAVDHGARLWSLFMFELWQRETSATT